MKVTSAVIMVKSTITTRGERCYKQYSSTAQTVGVKGKLTATQKMLMSLTEKNVKKDKDTSASTSEYTYSGAKGRIAQHHIRRPTDIPRFKATKG